MKNVFLAACAALFLSACAAYAPPPVDLPPPAAQAEDPGDIAQWWRSFGDPALDALVEEALAQNVDIRVAAARLEQARQAAVLTQSTLMPSLDFSGGASRSRISMEGNAPPGMPLISTQYTAGFAASYELDVWGRLSALRRTAAAGLKAQEQAQRAVHNTVAAETVRAYFTLRALERDEEILEKTQDSRRATLKLQKSRLDAGLINAYDFALVESGLNAVAVLLPQVRAAREQAGIALSVLAGHTPRRMAAGAVARGGGLPSLAHAKAIPPGLPANLLQRRPDVQAASYLLEEADGDVAAARARWFPAITLTGVFGAESVTLSRLMDEAARTWNAGALAVQPVLGLWTVRARVRRARAARDEAEAAYMQTARIAYADALAALSRHRAAQEEVSQARKLHENQSRVRDLAGQKLKAGQVGRLDVLDAERQELAAARGLIAAQRGQAITLVDVYQSLGGGW